MGIWSKSKNKSPKTTELMRNGVPDNSYLTDQRNNSLMVHKYGNDPRNYHPSPLERVYTDGTDRTPSKLPPHSTASAPNLLSRRKTEGRKGVKVPAQYDSDKQQLRDHIQQNYASGQSNGELWSWIPELPQSADDPEVTDRVRTVLSYAEQYVSNFFQDRPYKGDIPDEILDGVNCSLLSTSILQKALMSADYHTALIKHVLITLLLELISYDALADQESLLPKEFQNYSILAKARSRSKSAGDGGEVKKLQAALSAYRLLSAYLRSDVQTDENYTQERQPVIEDVWLRFDHAFRYWAREDKTDVDRQTMFSRLLSKAGDLGVFLFSQPSVYIFDWEVEQQEYSHYMIPITPRLLRMYDENGQKIEFADHMIPMQQEYIRQAGSSVSRPGTSTGTGTPLSVLEELGLSDAYPQQSRVPNATPQEYQAYSPTAQLPRSSESPIRRGSLDTSRDQGQFDSRNQSLAGRPTDAVPQNSVPSRDRMGPSSFPRGPRDAPSTLKPSVTGQKPDVNRRPLPPTAQVSTSEPHQQPFTAPTVKPRSYSIHELDASEPVNSSTRKPQQSYQYYELDASAGRSITFEQPNRSESNNGTSTQVHFNTDKTSSNYNPPPPGQDLNPHLQPTSPRSSDRHRDLDFRPQPKTSRSNSSSPPKSATRRHNSKTSYPPTRDFDAVNARSAELKATDPAYGSLYAPDIPARNGSRGDHQDTTSRSGSKRDGSSSGRGRSFSDSHGSDQKRSLSLRRMLKRDKD